MTATLRQVGARVAAHWQLKATFSVVLTVLFCVPYFVLQRVGLFPVQQLTASAVDRAIPFAPEWVWIYQSVYLLLSIVPWLSDSAADLRRYARGFVAQSFTGFVVFLLFPLEVPRPDGVPVNSMFRLLVAYDRPLNTFPSLHVGLSVYTVLFAAWMSRARVSSAGRTAVLVPLTLWTIAIAFSALATKQHYAIDLVAGVLLALVCHRWAFNRAAQRRAHAAESIPSCASAGSLGSLARLSASVPATLSAPVTAGADATRDHGSGRGGS